ncbi:hypothetical protein FOC4_g10001538 [Fusarium odoratissimum]|uniref:Uncharacterized protein n=1 Tax=Fusarium oxysporum f. sp. cubense (strain race 4) TaxID=2502994 RepID=N1S3X1_FUSC4|nr:hypothetical protein FOC4_g10001538 [Fusarium odoratissimum]
MGGGPDKSEVPSRVDPSGASEDAPDEYIRTDHNSRPMTDSVSHDTSEVLAVTELDGASSQSPRPDKGDAVDIESHENTKVNDSDDDTATIKQPETRPITHDQLVAEVKGIYAGLGMVEKKCIEVDDGQMPWTDGPPDIPSYLLTIPEAMLILLKMGEEARKKVIDGKYYLNIGYDLVDQLLRDLETVKSRAKEPALGLLAIWPFIHAGCHRLWNMVRALLVFLCFRLCGLTKSESEKTPAIELPIYVEIRPLSDQSRYKKVGTEYWVLVSGRWIRSLRGEQMAVEERDINARERWRNTAREEYTQARNDDPTVGRHYHHLAILVQPRSSSPDTSFDADVSRFLYYTNSLVVKTPFYAARKSVLTVIKTIVGRNKEAAEKPVSFPQTDQDHFLTAVAHLILASLEPETRKANGYEGSRNNHLQTVYTALEKIKVGGPAKTSRLCPSAQLGLLLCQLLLGIPLADNRWSPMMAKFAPDLVTDEDRSDSDAMANARDIHDATIELINTMVPYLLEGADTRALGVWRFILVILMFMRSLKTRPALREWWFGSAFHAEALTPYFNLILRQDEIQGAAALASASQSELITAERARSTATPDDGTVTTDENSVITGMATVNAEGSQTAAEESMATTEQTTASDTTHKKGEDTKAPGPERMFLYYTNSLVVKTPFYAARKSVLTVIKTIVGRNKEAAEKPVSFPQTDQDHFLTAVAHLILASLEPETRKANGYEGSRNNHLQTVYTALEKIKVGGPAKTSRLCPSAQLGLLLCQLLLGIPLADNRWSPMMAKFAPDLVTDEDRSDSDAMANARDIHDATIELINTMVPYLLEGADTRALGVWRFILVILMFMRSLKTRPALREWWFGSAFHAEALTPYFNLILRQDEIQGAAALASASQSELITILLAAQREKEARQKPTKDAVQTAEVPAVEQAQETTLTDAKTDSEARDGVLTNSASENEAEYDILTNSVAGEAQKEQQAKIEAVEAPSADVEMKESENKNARQQDSDTQTKEEDAEKTQLEDEQKRGEAEEARLAQEAGEEEIRRQEGLRRDPPLFPNGWLKQSKYSFDEIQVFDYVESLEMCNDRFVQILRLATQLIGDFFDLKTDEERRPWFSVPGVSSVPKLEPSKMMPDIIERDSGFRVVFVDPSFHAVELKEEEERLARTEEMRKEKERQNEEKSAEAAPGAAAVVDEKTEGNAEEAHGFRCPCGVDVVDRPLGLLRLLFNRVSGLARFGDLVSCTDPTGALSIIAENGDDDDATSAFDLELRKATRTAKTITAAEELSSTDDSEPAESKAWTTLPVQGVNDMQHTKGSDAVKGPGAGEDEDEDEEGWSHVSDDSLGNDEPDPTVQSGKFETRSMASRWFFN